ncbi:integral membrane sensor signal transduction histidine kinase [Caldicellulosiruptor saccharolyticus DSM 8903]|uniref:histidine kinase n=1 Tax=Caldicellulosiruptor saccharolyticus (strain ATCC 43494 / DSM 8903 / Tp8T 6331) TaxID=351627 RepID=A4XJ72_CALS8|nr:sensor histidine kinase [Caldicellulosiruptor saccharolyticus]ABP66957.1 integral membrane sensor signal transduction histidine kinase [Caldicellulosiruptor saccharolyticus DSM 8903]
MKLFFANLKIKKKFILAFVISALIPQTILGIILFLNLRTIALENAIKDTRKNVEDVKIKLTDIVQNAVDISNKLYLDKKLLNILSTEYKDISKMCDDYTSYTELSNLMSIYSKNIHAIKIYAFNSTLLDTGEIVKVDDYTKNQEWFKRAIKGDGKILWELVYDNNPFRPQYYFSLIRLIKNSYGERIGVMVIYIKKEKLEEVLSLHINTLVVSDRGIIVAARDKNLVGKKLNFNFSSQDGKLIENVNINGQMTMAILGTISASESGSSFLKVISFFSKKEIFKRVNKITFITFVLILVNSLVSLLLMLLFSKLITDRIAILNKKVNEISHGNLDAQINILGNDEIGQLTENIKTMAKNIKNLIDQVYLAEVQKQQIIAKQREIQFEMLCSQINPHFLFNTLEAIRMKAFCTGQYEIAQVVYLLSNLLRKSIEMTIDLITLEKEVEIVKEFLEIQKFRFGDKIYYKIEVQDDLLSSKVLPFIIQPLVENSIRHGIEPIIGKGTIEIKVFKKDGTIKIIVTDNGAGMPKEKLEEVLQSLDSKDKSHVGLKNVFHRLKLFYGEEAKIFINSELGKGTSVEIQIPKR